MISNNYLTIPPIHLPSLFKRMAIGTAIGLVAILFFVLQVDNPNPEWGEYWIIKPLIITPLSGAAGGACNYLINYQFPSGTSGVIAMIFGILVFIVGLWMGIVLGLNRTMWH